MAKKRTSYKSDAEHHAQKIEYYHANAGENGYSQSKHHYSKLAEYYSKGAQAPGSYVIQQMYIAAGKLMEEMEKREKDAIAARKRAEEDATTADSTGPADI